MKRLSLKKGFLILLLILGFSAKSQYAWWVEIHNWDWVSHWSDYMSFQPGTMGPNALPVPDLQNGRMDTNLTLLVTPEVHLAKNDFTFDIFTRVNIPIKNAVALQIWWVPFEYYKTDTVVRDFRAARTREAEGTATGDVYLGMLIPLVTDKEKWPDLMLSINLKTASGSKLKDARFTDAPGYWFDLSGGKDLPWKNHEGWFFRPFGSAGFYVYQTNSTIHFQNDALMLGAGLDLKNEKWRFSLQYAQYSGYWREYDLPKVLRLETEYTHKNLTYHLRLQQGNESYNFTSIRAGVRYNFSPLLNR
ncbi:MAG: hypothetical protein N4A46_07080 [Schleiferiaceae bacterium]|nr:hypothetical protein [Schleiferiaceae bacterium]